MHRRRAGCIEQRRAAAAAGADIGGRWVRAAE